MDEISQLEWNLTACDKHVKKPVSKALLSDAWKQTEIYFQQVFAWHRWLLTNEPAQGLHLGMTVLHSKAGFRLTRLRLCFHWDGPIAFRHNNWRSICSSFHWSSVVRSRSTAQVSKSYLVPAAQRPGPGPNIMHHGEGNTLRRCHSTLMSPNKQHWWPLIWRSAITERPSGNDWRWACWSHSFSVPASCLRCTLFVVGSGYYCCVGCVWSQWNRGLRLGRSKNLPQLFLSASSK